MNDNQPQTAAAQKADRHFRKEMHEKAGAAAWAEYQAGQTAILEKTARLKELRLAKEATLPKATPKVAKPKKKTVTRASSK
ncbi:transcriptional regulator [Blastochloris viridis]|uniref:Uncharacterized protein n=1 Tax=Blastochloris viridis TaxID=1079 RepID=A0A0H5BJ80_BLAVI|nr:transcriptional regulator [Blastochloris viridis]ALK09608.1 hypothetical protein BVIR_1834 [Blastochloris viridis]BAS00502.1 hypothetical protein BV133_2908 [Blastochloris viridis]CUU42271.1 hypothetical protein BVIRIDIS_12790 [Blastochloris viridis]